MRPRTCKNKKKGAFTLNDSLEIVVTDNLLQNSWVGQFFSLFGHAILQLLDHMYNQYHLQLRVNYSKSFTDIGFITI